MNKYLLVNFVVGIAFLLVAIVVTSASANALSTWHTFLGSSSYDFLSDITADKEGNIYVIGNSNVTWGPAPLNPHSGGDDTFIAKLNGNGALEWNTFLGGATGSESITLDEAGNIYIVGSSVYIWGTSPINPYTGGREAYIAKLNNNGVLQWHTFLGSYGEDYGQGIILDKSGNIYVIGESEFSWGSSPVYPHMGDFDVFVAKLNNNGVLQWHTFLGSYGEDYGRGIGVDATGNLYLTGWSQIGWGLPINPYAGAPDAFVAKLNHEGVRQWHTFLGSSNWDEAWAIALDVKGNIYIAGMSPATWGHPLNPYAGGIADAFAAKLSSNGRLQWNSFMGASTTDEDIGNAIAVDEFGDVYIGGMSFDTWGTSPINPHSGGRDIFIAKIHVNELFLPFIQKRDRRMINLLHHSPISSFDQLLTYAATGSPTTCLARSNISEPSLKSTRMVSPSLKSPCSKRRASGSCSSRWMTRLSGRAPKVGS
ncbi:MAG: SBBP repeat-containing protein [Anaerolineae bacterium]|nr:SBBP repeat-containing protein [Anaerolineae bacterium]